MEIRIAQINKVIYLEIGGKMDKEFSEGFLHDLADLLDMCSKGDTDTISLSFNINGRQLNVEMTFSVENK